MKLAMIGIDLLGFAVSVALFAWLKKGGSPFDRNASSEGLQPAVIGLQNSAFVFVKTHANTPATQQLVREKLQSSGINILSEVEISGEKIDEKKLIDQHYYAIASKATIIPAKDIIVPLEKFQESFGESWETALKEKRACNALEACDRFACDPQQLNEAWGKAEKVVKFGGGFYCGLVTMNGLTLYVFNAFFMSMRSKFVGKGTSIHCFEVSWDPQKLSWASFRHDVLGPTDPAEAPEGSLRKSILERYTELGLSTSPNKGDNGVHASASPFEGLAEKMNWMGREVEKDSFGKEILEAGISKDTVKEWSVDPRIILMPDGTQGSLFDALEDMDARECLAKMKELDDLNK